MKNNLGLYIHIPFCRSKCAYCDFCSIPAASESTVNEYLSVLNKSIANGGVSAGGYAVDTVYFGGGTPTTLGADALLRLLDTAAKNYALTSDCEITTEANPGTVDKEALCALRGAGFNRISFGLQSANDRELAALSRIHTRDEFERCYLSARDAGFKNISVDLMSGIPYQTNESFAATLDYLTRLRPEHISVYGLIIEEGTRFFAERETLPLPDEDTERQMYFDCIERLSADGYGHYEISNYSLAGYESRHNLKYWNCDEYLSFGASAASYFRGRRFTETRDIDEYIRRGGNAYCEEEILTESERETEYVMLRLRLADGVDKNEYAVRFGGDFEEKYAKRLEKYISAGLAKQNKGKYSLTDGGMYVSNTILSDILDL